MKTETWLFSALLLLASAALMTMAACGDDDDDAGETNDDVVDDDDNDGIDDDDDAFTLTSGAFDHLGNIPVKYTCDDAVNGFSPPLAWVNPPAGTAAFAITLRDPDAPSGDFHHWGLINIPADVAALEEGISPGGVVPENAWETLNGTGGLGYFPPCPPADDAAHRYNFTLYALDSELPSPVIEVALADMLDELEAAALATTTLTGYYDR